MKRLKIAIVCIVIIIIILIILLLLTLNSEKISEGIIETEKVHTELEPIENANVEKVSNRNDYYTIKYILDTYFEYVNYINPSAESLEIQSLPNQQEIMEEYNDTATKSLRNILDEEYFADQKTDEKIRTNAANYKNENFRIKEIYYQDKTLRKTVYFVYVILDYQQEIPIIVKLDEISNCFSILPPDYIEENNYSENSMGEIQVNDIVANENNQYEYISVTDEMMAKSYMEDFAEIVLDNTQESYKFLKEEYKQKRFPTWEEYDNYVRTSEKDYEMLRLMQYQVNDREGYTEYICEDQYGNRYIFEETAIMEYTVQLDDYTLENETVNEKYGQTDSLNKATFNIDKFFEMLNMQDYTAAYEVLDTTFKQNYFATQGQFEEYMQGKFFRYNNVTYNSYAERVTNLYTFNLTITDKTGEQQTSVDFNIVMQLLDGTDFVMSFEIE